MSTLNDLNLQNNPFREITPSLEDTSPFWAGMQDVRTRIERCYADCISNNSKQIVLNWGPYGGGKTFSAYYFINEYDSTENITHLYLRTSQDGAAATDEFFKSIIDFLTVEKIQAQVQALINSASQEELMAFLTPKAGREYAKAICLFGSDDNDVIALMNRFLYSGLTKTELKNLGLAKVIQTDVDSIKFLTGILSCFIGESRFNYEGRVVLWLDEMENLIYYNAKHYKAFSQVIRDLVDSISRDFLVFLNFTLAEGEESTIELILGGAVWSRITKKIRFKQFNVADAVQYSQDLLSHAKLNKNLAQPFSVPVLNNVLEMIPAGNLTPREINKHFTSLLNYAIEHDLSNINHQTFIDWSNQYQEEN
jgi:hypothetical protein